MTGRGDESELFALADFGRLPNDDAHRLELVRGRVVREPRPAPLHARVAARLTYYLEAYAQATGGVAVLANGGFVLGVDPPTVRGPDIAVVSNGRVPVSGYGDEFWHIGPDLATEIRARSERAGATQERIRDYFSAGVGVVWVIDPRGRAVIIHERGRPMRWSSSADLLLCEEVLPVFVSRSRRCLRSETAGSGSLYENRQGS